MKHKTRESLRELRLWGVQIIAPTAVVLMTAMTNPEVQRMVKTTVNVVKNKTEKVVFDIKQKIKNRAK